MEVVKSDGIAPGDSTIWLCRKTWPFFNKGGLWMGKEVFVNRIEDTDIRVPKEDKWANLVSSIDYFSDDFMIERYIPSTEDKREEF